MAASGYRDYFKVLGVDRNAGDADIKRAFRKLARKYHPDVNPEDPQAEAKFKEVSEAYEVLSDPEKRKRYEQFGQYWNQSSGFDGQSPFGKGFDVDFGGYGNFDDFINELLGRFSGDRSPGSPNMRPRSSQSSIQLDAEVKLKVSFSEAYRGTNKILSINNERVQVKIPKGVKPGSKLRVKGKGNIQPGTGRRGDLYLVIEVKPHPVWKIDGLTIRADLPISICELALGGNISVMTPSGHVNINIPSGTSPGQNLRLKGQGWPSDNAHGDLIFTLKIDLPNNWSSQELELLHQLNKVSSNQSRKDWIDLARL